MMSRAGLADALQGLLHCPVERDRPLSALSTLGVGGWAECYAEPTELEDFLVLRRFSHREGVPFHIVGGGSNVVFADGPIPGVVVSTRRWSAVRWLPREDRVVADVQAGYGLASLVAAAAKRGLTGLEFALGIPGTVGGAVAGNAGAGGRSVGDGLEEVLSAEPDGTLRRWGAGEFSCSYRRCSLSEPGRLLLSCKMILGPAPRAEIEESMERFRSARRIQPHGGRSAGCSFKNPDGESAGRLLDRCGCKGMAIGDAVVSDRHANFILNRGRATAKDVLSLLRACRRRVFERTGVLLEPEVRFLGWEPAWDEEPAPDVRNALCRAPRSCPYGETFC